MKNWFNILLLVFVSLVSSCQNNSHSLKVAATSVPHAEILEVVKPQLAKEGLHLDIIVVEDFNTPNRALQDKEVDANFFQHRPFMDMQMQDFGYQLESLAAIHLEPMALYSKKIRTLNQLSNRAIVAIPSDPTNQARALNLLQAQGLIEMTRNDAKASLLHIVKNPKQLKFIEIDSPLLSRSLDDVEMAAITTNFALQAGLSPQRDALAMESADSLFANLLVIRQGDATREDLQQLKAAMTSEQVKEFIKTHYRGAVIPSF
jgi:D-methionine transport system substrate-binding protein